MNLNPPSEFENYQYDQKAAARSSLPSCVLGWLSLLSLAAAVFSFFFLPGRKLIVMGSCVGFLVLFSAYLISKIMKRQVLCSQCQRAMETVDVKWTPEQWLQIQEYEMMESCRGADGNLYTVEREKGGGSTHYFIHAHLQRWTVCRLCRSYFLNAPYLQERLFSTVHEAEFEQAKNSLLTDPDASAKMASAYIERLQG